MTSRKDRLAALYDLLLDEMKDRLENGDEQFVASTGEHVRVKASASTLKTIATFLKDEGMEATEDNPALTQLKDILSRANLPDYTT